MGVSRWAAGLLGCAVTVASAQVTLNDIAFIERQSLGQVSLGNNRGGIGVLDFDGDGWRDLLVGGGVGQLNRLYRNVPDPSGGRNFVDATVGSGLDDADGTARDAVGVLTADYDNDGDADVYLVGRGAGPTFGLLYRNDGGAFTNASEASGLRRPGGGKQCAGWADYDLDGDLDLIVAGNFPGYYMNLFANNGDGTFSDVTSILPAIAGFGNCYALLWMDYDRDGWSDCFLLSNAGAGTEVVLHNVPASGGGRAFVNTAEAIGFTQLGPAPMGLAVGDFDNDGDLDIGVSDALVGTYYENVGGTFVKAFWFETMFGWGVHWLDADNDGDLEFYTAGSWAAAAPNNLQENLGDGSFSDVSAALNGPSRASQYSTLIDVDSDGFLDIATVNPNHSVSLYENASPAPHHWAIVALRGDGRWVSRDAVGALVRLTAGGETQVREVINGSSTTSTEDQRLHFGLGEATQIDQIEVTWPRAGTVAARTELYVGPFVPDRTLVLAPQRYPGDLNCDQSLDSFDIGAFVLALTAPDSYALTYPECPRANADVNGDAVVDAFDIGAFVDALTSG